MKNFKSFLFNIYQFLSYIKDWNYRNGQDRATYLQVFYRMAVMKSLKILKILLRKHSGKYFSLCVKVSGPQFFNVLASHGPGTKLGRIIRPARR